MDNSMNIFVLSNNPIECAQMHCDRHVVKMILESAQLLCTAISMYENIEGLYKPTHHNHPCSIWVRQSSANFLWLSHLAHALSDEYTFRYGKTHKSLEVLNRCRNIIPEGDLTPFALAMPDEYKTFDAVESYRKYYIGEKHQLLTYTNRDIPNWIKERNLGTQKIKL